MNRLLSKGMSNIQLEVTIEKNMKKTDVIKTLILYV